VICRVVVACGDIDACRSCQKHVKTLDLTVNGAAIDIDDLASLALDLWAAGRDC
jgi:formate dehydrogenase maturation protein FdhE